MSAAIDFIALDKPRAALRQLQEIERQAVLLRDHAFLGRPGRVTGTRELVITGTPFILVYRTKGDIVQILHLLHGSRQWP